MSDARDPLIDREDLSDSERAKLDHEFQELREQAGVRTRASKLRRRRA